MAHLRLVQQSATRAAHLINRLLMLARADPEAAMAQDQAPLDLVALVHQAHRLQTKKSSNINDFFTNSYQ